MFALLGCSHTPPTPAAVAGNSSFAFVEATSSLGSADQTSASTGPRQPVDVLVAAEPLHPLATPVYPDVARGRHPTPALVGVRIVVDVNGGVSEVGPSLRALTTPGPFAAEFLAAVKDAVAQWRFRPAEKRHLVPGRGGPMRDDYWIVMRAEKTEAVFDVAFTFAPSGDVVSPAP